MIEVKTWQSPSGGLVWKYEEAKKPGMTLTVVGLGDFYFTDRTAAVRWLEELAYSFEQFQKLL